MKKTLLFMLFLLSVVTVSARSAYFNVRVGGGLTSGIVSPAKIGDAILRPGGGATFLFQSNILLSKSKDFILSPSLQYEYAGIGDRMSEHVVSVPILFGYRIRLGNGIFLVPKLGPTFGYRIGEKDHESSYYANSHYSVVREEGGFIVGPYLDLCFEIKHFVIALNGYYSFTSQDISLFDGYYWNYEHSLSSVTEGSSLKALHGYGLFMTIGYKF